MRACGPTQRIRRATLRDGASSAPNPAQAVAAAAPPQTRPAWRTDRWKTGRRRRLTKSGSRRPDQRRLQLQVLPKAPGLRSADRDLRRLRVCHPEDVIPAEPRNDLLHFVDIHQVRAVDPPEHLGVEPRMQLFEGSVVRCPRYLISHNINRILDERRMDDVVSLHKDKTVIYLDGHLVPAVLLARHHLDQPVQLTSQRLVFSPPAPGP